MALTVCLSVFYICLKHLWGLQTVSSHENLRSNYSRRLYDANILLDIRHTADASRLPFVVCRVTVIGKLFTPIVLPFTEQQNW